MGSPNQDVSRQTLLSPVWFLHLILSSFVGLFGGLEVPRMSAAGLFSSSSALFSSPEFLSLDNTELLPLDAPDFDQLSLPAFADLRNSFIVSILASLVTEIGEMMMQLAIVGTARVLISPFLAPLGFTGSGPAVGFLPSVEDVISAI